MKAQFDAADERGKKILIARAMVAQKNVRLREQFAAKGGFLPFVHYLWPVLEPMTPLVDGWPLEALCLHLEALARGEIDPPRFLANVCPGFMKSLLTNVFLPAYIWGPLNKPHIRFLAFSYASSLTERDNRRFLRIITSTQYQTLYANSFALQKAGEVLISNDKTGWKLASSVGGVGTGERADYVLCFPWDQKVATENGYLPIGEIVDNKLKARAWSYNERTHTLELKPIVGWKKNPGRQLLKLTTEDGSSVTCTLDHKILTINGYHEAASLVVGDLLLAAPRRMLGTVAPVVRTQFKVQMPPRLAAAYACNRLWAYTKLLCKNKGRIFVPLSNFSHLVRRQIPRSVLECSMDLGVRDIVGSRPVFKIAKARISPVAVSVANLMVRVRRTYKCQHDKLVDKAINALAVLTHGYTRIALIQDGRHQLAWDAQSLAAPYGGSWHAFQSSKIGNEITSVSRNFVPDFLRVVSIERIHDIPPSTYCITVEGNHNLCCGDDARIICANCDDPHNVKEAESEVVRNNTVTWFKEAMQNRLNDPKKSAIIVIMQRVNDGDVSGVIREEYKSYDILTIPMIYDSRDIENGVKKKTKIGWSDPRTKDGEIAWPERYDLASLEPYMNQAYLWASQYQQTPEPRGGAIIRRSYWQKWEADRFPSNISYILASADTAYTQKQSNDPSALTVWGLFSRDDGQPCVILMNAWRKRLVLHGENTERRPGELEGSWIDRTQPQWGLCEWMAYTCRRFKVHKLLLEGKASGLSVEQELRRVNRGEGWSLEITTPDRDKVARAHASISTFADNLVYAPNRQYARMVIDETAAFPFGRYKDLTDTVTQAIKHFRDNGLLLRRTEKARYDDEERRTNHHPEPLYPV